MTTRGRVSTEEKKRVEKKRGHSGVTQRHGKFVRVDGEFVFVADVEPEKVGPRERVDFRKSVEPATTGTCMFCSRTDAEFRFKGDDSVRICGRCVKS